MIQKKLSNKALSETAHRVNSLNFFFEVIQHAYEEVNDQKYIYTQYNSLCQCESVSDYAYNLLVLTNQLILKSSNFEILEHFKVDLQHHVLNCFTDKLKLLTALFKYFHLTNCINYNWFENCWMQHCNNTVTSQESFFLNVFSLQSQNRDSFWVK